MKVLRASNEPFLVSKTIESFIQRRRAKRRLVNLLENGSSDQALASLEGLYACQQIGNPIWLLLVVVHF